MRNREGLLGKVKREGEREQGRLEREEMWGQMLNERYTTLNTYIEHN